MIDQPQAQPLFLVGAARSGTSLLYKLLSLHPEAVWLSNWVQRYPGLPQLAALNGLADRFPRRRHEVWFGKSGNNAYVYGRRRPLRDRVFPMPAEGESLYARAGIPEPGLTPLPAPSRTQCEALQSTFYTMRRAAGGRVLISKRIANNRRIGLLHNIFPQARFLDIMRDGRAVALSLSEVDWWEDSVVWWFGGTPTEWRGAGKDPWELCARNWVEEVKIIERDLPLLPEPLVQRIRYEDLVAEPHPVLAQCASFAGLDPDERRWRRALSRVRFPNKNERWREKLAADALATVESVQEPELRRYGYLPHGR